MTMRDPSVAVRLESDHGVMAMAFPDPASLQRWLRDHPGCRVRGEVGVAGRRGAEHDSRPGDGRASRRRG